MALIFNSLIQKMLKKSKHYFGILIHILIFNSIFFEGRSNLQQKLYHHGLYHIADHLDIFFIYCSLLLEKQNPWILGWFFYFSVFKSGHWADHIAYVKGL